MSKNTQFAMKVLLAVVLVSMMLYCSKADAQESLKVDFNVYLDYKKVESDSIFVSQNGSPVVKITDSFVTWLLPNKKYKFIISYSSFNKQIIEIDTNNSKRDSLSIRLYLSKNNKEYSTCYNGYFNYY
jgi:hypothetical protein